MLPHQKDKIEKPGSTSDLQEIVNQHIENMDAITRKYPQNSSTKTILESTEITEQTPSSLSQVKEKVENISATLKDAIEIHQEGNSEILQSTETDEQRAERRKMEEAEFQHVISSLNKT